MQVDIHVRPACSKSTSKKGFIAFVVRAKHAELKITILNLKALNLFIAVPLRVRFLFLEFSRLLCNSCYGAAKGKSLEYVDPTLQVVDHLFRAN